MQPTEISTVDDYIAAFPRAIQELLQAVRNTIRTVAPEAQEKIGYGMPTFVLQGKLVHFAAFKHHIGFYPGAKAIEIFHKEFSRYPTSKGAVQFPLDQPIPHATIAKVVAFRVRENTQPKPAPNKPKAKSKARPKSR